MVSILTRPWGRVQPKILAVYSSAELFQSSPARGAGATPSVIEVGELRTTGFNPHPPVGAGATRSGSTTPPRGMQLFQSSPARGGGCNMYGGFKESECSCVSILTRPWGRVQRTRRTAKGCPARGFNPHPPVGAGATPNRARSASCWGQSFQSSPARGGGCNCIYHACCIPRRMFQSSPARGGGCNAQAGVLQPDSNLVSILTRRWGGCNRPAHMGTDTPRARFNPHPPVGAGATRLGERAGAVPQTQVFQLSRCAVPRSGRLTAAHSPTDTRYAASRPAAACPLAPSSR